MFRVEWIDEAIDELAAIWTHADSDKRPTVTEATNMIDRELKADPFRQSESRNDERRVLFAPPLAVFFRVDVAEKVVWVGHVWSYSPRKK
jgi:hypothetical protein